ncbi:MAG TPA: phosphotransferase [Myxococcota bacterium]|nr:phosphotransferase [Myxococcota bacterium]
MTPLDEAALPGWLESRDLLRAAGARVERAGDGNINWVRRAIGADGTRRIVKQARPALEKFPEYRVDTARIVFEARYMAVLRREVPGQARILPKVFFFDELDRALVLEDVSPAERLDELLDAGRASADTLFALGEFLGAVHRATAAQAPLLVREFANDEMRKLHGEHVFSLPFAPNDFPIEPRLRALADAALATPGVRTRIAALRGRYYESRESLVHGDVQAGNVLVQNDRPRLLDAEIAHVGDPAFDLGQALAHVHVHRVRARDEADCARWERALVDGYAPTRELLARARGYAGVEILRRAIGAARLALLGTTARAERALELGTALLGAE